MAQPPKQITNFNPFSIILKDGLNRGIVPNKTQEARDWYRARSGNFMTSPNQVLATVPNEQLRSNPKVGDMYMYWYDPKHKKTLPLYDMFPLIILYQKTENGFMGLNMHYLGLPYRAVFMDALYKYTNDTTYDEKTKIVMTYKLMQSSFKLRWYRKCIHRYLQGHVRSNFIYIPPSQWDIALFLPVQKFNDQNEYIKTLGAGNFRMNNSFKS